MSQTLKSIRIIKDFPKKGIAFYDISTILSSPSKFHLVVNKMAKEVKKINADTIVGIDSRGFIFAFCSSLQIKKKTSDDKKKRKTPW
jgi:adenine phosphoribosyltransferase